MKNRITESLRVSRPKRKLATAVAATGLAMTAGVGLLAAGAAGASGASSVPVHPRSLLVHREVERALGDTSPDQPARHLSAVDPGSPGDARSADVASAGRPSSVEASLPRSSFDG
jgi:hypothetical protein